jgi:predicted transcriptional regulator
MAALKLQMQFDVERVRKAATAIFGEDDQMGKTWAKKSGVSYSTIRNFLNGRPLKPTTFEKIVAPTGVDVNSVLRINGKKLA